MLIVKTIFTDCVCTKEKLDDRLTVGILSVVPRYCLLSK